MSTLIESSSQTAEDSLIEYSYVGASMMAESADVLVQTDLDVENDYAYVGRRDGIVQTDEDSLIDYAYVGALMMAESADVFVQTDLDVENDHAYVGRRDGIVQTDEDSLIDFAYVGSLIIAESAACFVQTDEDYDVFIVNSKPPATKPPPPPGLPPIRRAHCVSEPPVFVSSVLHQYLQSGVASL